MCFGAVTQISVCPARSQQHSALDHCHPLRRYPSRQSARGRQHCVNPSPWIHVRVGIAMTVYQDAGLQNLAPRLQSSCSPLALLCHYPGADTRSVARMTHSEPLTGSFQPAAVVGWIAEFNEPLLPFGASILATAHCDDACKALPSLHAVVHRYPHKHAADAHHSQSSPLHVGGCEPVVRCCGRCLAGAQQ